MGKKSRALSRTKAAAPILPAPVEQTVSAEQMELIRQKQLKQARFSRMMDNRPVPTHWQPCIQYLAMLEKVTSVRDTDDTLKTLTDDQIVHGLITENLIKYSVSKPGTGEVLTMYSARTPYPKPRWPIQEAQPAEHKLLAEFGKQKYLKRFRPMFEPGVLVNGRLNIEAYFGALAQIHANDEAERARQESNKLIGASGKDIAAAIATGAVRPGDQVLGEHEHDHGNGLVQVETKKEAVVMTASNVGKSVPLSELVESFEQRSEEIPAVWPTPVDGAGSLTVEVDENDNAVDVHRVPAQEASPDGEERPKTWGDIPAKPEFFPPGDGTGITKGLYGDPGPDQ